MSVHLYVEGGGDSSALARDLRRAFSTFLRAGLGGAAMPRIVACGGRHKTLKAFQTALVTEPGRRNMLLVDAESSVGAAKKPWVDLASLGAASLMRPADAKEDDLHLMAVCMETWLIADRASFAAYFGVPESALDLPRDDALEQVEKKRLFHAIERATRESFKGKYRKSRDSFRILERCDPEAVRRLFWCDRFFRALA